MLTRREALALIATAPLVSAANAAETLSRNRYASMTVIDAKCWLEQYGVVSPDDRFAPSLLDAAKASGLTLISQTQGGSGSLDALKANVARLDARIEGSASAVMKVLSGSDLRAAKRSARLGIAYDVQGTNELGGDVANVKVLHDLGIRTVQLTYNLHTAAGDGCMVPNDGGITEFGRAVVAEVNRLKMLIDFSHVGHRTAAEGIAASTRAPAITHSGCHALNPHPRNMPDAQMKAVANKGGVFGIYFMSYLVAKGQEHKEDVLRHIEHAIQICGEDHVGIGTDGKVPPLVFDQSYRDYWRTEVYEPRVKNGTVAPNEGADIFNYTPEYNPADRYALLGEDLLRRGHSLARVEKILGAEFRAPVFRIVGLKDQMTMRHTYWLGGAALALAVTAAAAADYRAAPPGMPFSSAVQVGDILYLSGEIGEGPDGKLPAGMAAQTRQTMANIATTLKQNGLSFDDVFKCTVMLTDMSQWADFNEIYVGYFKPDRLPARSAIGANGLALGALVEVECWAHVTAKK